MDDLTVRVANALARSVVPSVIARGGNVRVTDVVDGVAILEVTGSPGAMVPLVSRVEALVLAAVPEITGVRIAGPDDQRVPPAGSLAERARHILGLQVNPAIAAHGGHAVVEVVDQGWVRIRLEGRCQGCSLAEVTLRQGIEPVLRERLPDMIGLVDVTDHASGTQPYYSAKKR
ncbi:MAG: NifU family protein [Actinomycetota bacterium]|nr:NifU family protein [Actinomycetota bacterium]